MRITPFRLVLMIGIFSIFSSNTGLAEKTTEKSVPPKKVEDSRQAEEKRLELRKQIEAKKLEINGSEWEINIGSQNAKAELVGPDSLAFQNGMFRSKTASKAGYTPTNYTITVSEEETGPTVWETMQTNADGEVTFWRGEWKEKKMSGVISRQLSDAKGAEDYYFSSASYKQIPPTSEPEKESALNKKSSAAAEAPVAKVLTSEAPKQTTKTVSKKTTTSKEKAAAAEAEATSKKKRGIFF